MSDRVDCTPPSALAVFPESTGESPFTFLWLSSTAIRMGSVKTTEHDGYDMLVTDATLP